MVVWKKEPTFRENDKDTPAKPGFIVDALSDAKNPEKNVIKFPILDWDNFENCKIKYFVTFFRLFHYHFETER